MKDELGTKERILKTAAGLFAEQGFERTSMRMIAEKSQVTKPAVYYYFPDKRHLFEELIRTSLEYSNKNIIDVRSSSRNAIEKLCDIVMVRFNEILFHPEIARFVYDVMSGNIPFEIMLDMKRELSPHIEFLNDIINDIIKEGQETGLFGKDIDLQSFLACFLGGINSFIMRSFEMGINDLTIEKARLMVNTLVYGIANPEYIRRN